MNDTYPVAMRRLDGRHLPRGPRARHRTADHPDVESRRGYRMNLDVPAKLLAFADEGLVRAAAHESGYGTFATARGDPAMSA